MTTHVIGIIGGSGLHEIAGRQDARREPAETPPGAPSDALLHGRLDGIRLVFLPRHGEGRRHDPGSVRLHAKVAAVKAAGVTHPVSVSAVVSFREAMAPGDVVVVDQIVEHTRAWPPSFFGSGRVAHVSLAHPVCEALARASAAAAREARARARGTSLAMEGPQFPRAADSRLYRSRGCDVIGMTNMRRARLARQAELHDAGLATVTDHDSRHPDHGSVSVEQVLATLAANVTRARDAMAALPRHLGREGGGCDVGCERALEHAVMTAPGARDPAVAARLAPVAGRVL